jgi:putative ABC transport system permease protein
VSLDGHSVNRYRVVDGRLPRGVDEMAINRTAADVLGKRVGDTLELQGRSPRQAERFMLEGDTSVLGEQPQGPQVVLRIAGVVEGPGDIGRVDLSGPYGVATAEFYARHGDAVAQFGPAVLVRLRNGYGDLPALQAAIHGLVGDSEIVELDEKRTDVDAINDALDVQALALLLFAGVAGAAGLVAIATALTRQLGGSGADAPVLSALGLTRRQRTVAVATVAWPAVLGGVVVGFVMAVLASPLLPIGLAGRAEPDPGLGFDAVVSRACRREGTRWCWSGSPRAPTPPPSAASSSSSASTSRTPAPPPKSPTWPRSRTSPGRWPPSSPSSGSSQ